MKIVTRRKLLAAFLLALSALASDSVTGQTTREVLTNDAIITLHELGLGDDVVIAKINQSECQCDTSTAALQKLKARKVSQKVILAILNAISGHSDSKPAVNSYPGSGGVPQAAGTYRAAAGPTDAALRAISEPGIYIYDAGKMVYIEPSVFSSSKTGGWSSVLTYGLKKSKVRAVLRGGSANIQLTNRVPEFYFVFGLEHRNQSAVMSGFYGYAATSPNEFVLLSMRIKDKTREVTLGEYGLGQMQTGVKDSEVREFSFEKVRSGVYKVVPKNDLDAGEYCFHYAGTTAGTKIFDFGVR